MKLIISSPGDMTVGIFPETWTLDCPFDIEYANEETLERFKLAQVAIYEEFDLDIRAEYDFEVEERQRMEDESEPDCEGSVEQYQRFKEERAKRDAWANG